MPGAAQALDRANELQLETWQCGPYNEEGRLLALQAFPGRYLVFRGTEAAQLPFYLREPTFSACHRDGSLEVLVSCRGNEYRVICEAVTFYQLEHPINIQSVWNQNPTE